MLSTYQEKIIFSEISIRLPLNKDAIINLEYIKFKKCEVINETKNVTIVDTRKDYSILQYNFTYHISWSLKVRMKKNIL